ncbi:hypothetical protein [Pelagibacterium montanilacus]|uniref:hypothetical protein n=1 Tax=Pelagibacterium montanilacus TaxID=2185280 RepID=UPI000F8ECE4B|nr:hypothetical protein [Pelagibacterium montanilacus]
MDAQRFRNILVTMMNIDLHELVEAGVIAAGNIDDGGSSWSRFNSDPLTFVAKLGDKQLEALWQIVAERQPVSTHNADYDRGLKAGVAVGLARAGMAINALRVDQIAQDVAPGATTDVGHGLQPSALDVRNALATAICALRSYQFGNGSPDLAEGIANYCDTILAGSAQGVCDANAQ